MKKIGQVLAVTASAVIAIGLASSVGEFTASYESSRFNLAMQQDNWLTSSLVNPIENLSKRIGILSAIAGTTIGFILAASTDALFREKSKSVTISAQEYKRLQEADKALVEGDISSQVDYVLKQERNNCA
jgi:hypothetical protein